MQVCGPDAVLKGKLRMETFRNSQGKYILLAMVKGIQDNKEYLGDVDGLIGDGDHGMNMNKGFSLFEKQFGDQEMLFSEGLGDLAMILMNEIGGSMGPIYGTIFTEMQEYLEKTGSESIGIVEFTGALKAALAGLYTIVDARPGDKTLVDCLSPVVRSMEISAEKGESFTEALTQMKVSALCGRDSTKDLIAKHGRSSRLGERSRGVLDAGACSCCIILTAMADSISALLTQEDV